MVFDFNFGNVMSLTIGALVPVAISYVRSKVELSAVSGKIEAHEKIAEAEKRLEDLAAKLIERIDAVKQAVVDLNVTLVRADERIAQSRLDIEKLDKRMSAMEDRCKACESQLTLIQRGPKAAAV